MKLIIYFSLLLFNCIGVYNTSPHFGLYVDGSHHVKHPLTQTLGEGNIIKKGTSCVTGIAILNFLIHERKNSIEEAMKQANITKVAVVDRSTEQILNIPYLSFYGKDCIIVYGE
jgi:hypothetical protein